jgi:hypothetical protein
MKQDVLCRGLFFVVFFILFLFEIVFAGVPVPWGAKILRDDISVSGSGEERKIATYETKASKQELLNYYLKEMPNRGYSLFMNGEQNLIFKKAEELVIVVVPPSQNDKTSFMVTSVLLNSASVMNSLSGGMVNCEPIPSVPVYPGARCMSSMHLKSGGPRTASYSTEDSSSVAIDFYRTQMPRYGWQLEKEMNFEDAMLKGMQGQPQLAANPNRMVAMQDLIRGARGMSFINLKGYSCTVNVMNNIMNKGMALINIVYEEKLRKQ